MTYAELAHEFAAQIQELNDKALFQLYCDLIEDSYRAGSYWERWSIDTRKKLAHDEFYRRKAESIERHRAAMKELVKDHV